MSLITIATDYRTTDGFSAVIKGIIKSIAPNVEIIDITNDLSTIQKTSLVLYRYYSNFPSGTIHLVIIDPAVGSPRRALAGTDGKYLFIGPDNGIFTQIIQSNPRTQWYCIENSKLPTRENIAATFHGRDIFAPAAALLSLGKRPDEFGKLISDPVLVEFPEPFIKKDIISGEIIDIDAFGNLIININGNMLKEIATVSIKNENIPLKKTFSDVRVNFPVAYIGSLGFLEIAINQGQAAEFFDAAIGDKVEVTCDLPCL